MLSCYYVNFSILNDKSRETKSFSKNLITRKILIPTLRKGAFFIKCFFSKISKWLKTSPALDFFCLIFQEVGVFLRCLLFVRVSSYWKYVYKKILYLKLKTGIGSCMFRFSLVYWQTCYFQTFDDVITNNCYHGNSKVMKMSFQI